MPYKYNTVYELNGDNSTSNTIIISIDMLVITGTQINKLVYSIQQYNHSTI